MYNIVRHLVEGREGIETYLKLKHLNSFANIESEYIYLPSVSVCERVFVCVCACCSPTALALVSATSVLAVVFSFGSRSSAA